MKVFVTGATGFLGTHVVMRLLREQHEVTCLIRNAEYADMVAQLGCRAVEGSLDNIGEWSKWLRGHDVVIHAAAPVVMWGDWAMFDRLIVKATDKLYRAASREGVKRFIYISSESVVQNGTPLLDIDETFPYLEPDSPYGKAKQQAERLLLDGVSETECIILRPTFLWGKGMPALDQIMDKIRSGKFMWVNQGRAMFEWLHVENAADAIVCALTRGEDKGVYFITDDNAKPVKEVFTALLTARGVEPPQKNISSGMARFAAGLLERIWKLFGVKSPPPITHFEWSFVALPRRYNIEKARTELGYHPAISEKMGLAGMRC